MTSFADKDYLKRGRVMLPEELDELDARYPTLISGVIGDVSTEFQDILDKRYGTFPDYPATPVALSNRVAAAVIQRLWATYGASPTNSEKTARIDALADAAWTWVRDAADSEKGLIELPASATGTADAITKTSAFGYSEASPFRWTDVQAEIGREEDGYGRRR